MRSYRGTHDAVRRRNRPLIHLVRDRSRTAIQVFGHGGQPLLTLPLPGAPGGKVVPLHRVPRSDPRPGHYLVTRWTRGGAGVAARLELADLDLSTEARLIDAGSARRDGVSRLLVIRGIAAPVGGLDGRRDVTIHAANDAARRGPRLAQTDLLRLIALLDADPARGTVVLTI